MTNLDEVEYKHELCVYLFNKKKHTHLFSIMDNDNNDKNSNNAKKKNVVMYYIYIHISNHTCF